MLKILESMLKFNSSVLKWHKNACFSTLIRNNETYEQYRSRGYRADCSRNFHFSMPRNKKDDRRNMLASLPPKQEGTEGERSVEIDSLIEREKRWYPNKDTFTTLYNGVPFKDLPICNIKVTKNNTIFSITNSKGVVQLIRSCGIEGFKNTRKGTNIAAQATAISTSVRALDKGFKTIRVRIQGLGPGRMSAIKGLQMGGLDIVSLTDNTRVSDHPRRARKQRRV